MKPLRQLPSSPSSHPANLRRKGSRPGGRAATYGPPALLLGLLAAACGVLSPEEQLLTDFFEASRLHDTTVVARMSDVTFNPRIDGVVDHFEVTGIEQADDGLSEQVTIRAQVRGAGAQVVSKTMVATLRRQNGRWFIASLRDL